LRIIPPDFASAFLLAEVMAILCSAMLANGLSLRWQEEHGGIGVTGV
jgi:hypothetical protein